MELIQLEMLLPGFAMVLARMSGIMISAPMFSSSQMPTQIKVMLAIALALLAYPVVIVTLPARLTLSQAAVGCVGELMIGEIIGLGVGVVFFGASMAGNMISHQAGLTFGEVVNPVFDSETTVLDQLWFFMALMVFLAVGGHLVLMKAVLNSFHQVPPMSAWADEPLSEHIVALLQCLFETALRLAGPTIVALMLALLALGVLSRTMPQFNLMNVGFSFKIALALFVSALSMASADDFMVQTLRDSFARVGDILTELGRTAHAGG